MSSGPFKARPRAFVRPSVPMTSSLRGLCHDPAGGAAGYGLTQTAPAPSRPLIPSSNNH
jgi:hypothetical protein